MGVSTGASVGGGVEFWAPTMLALESKLLQVSRTARMKSQGRLERLSGACRE
jgi:hypothetical protein